MSNPGLTEAQKREAYEAWEAEGRTINAAARRLGIQKMTFRNRLEAYFGGKIPETERSTARPEGVADPAEIRDAAFWRRKAVEAGRRADEADHALRELAGLSERPIAVPEWAKAAPGKPGRAAGLIHLSDLHCGEVVRREETGGINEYNPDIFVRRLRRMISAAIEILPRWSADCDLQGVVVALNGDLISGDIHDELRRTNALTSHDQVALVTDELAAGIGLIADEFDNVLVTVTPGNHGRTTEKTHAKRMAALSYDTMIGNMLARHFQNDQRVTVNVSAGADIAFPLLGWTVLQTHGDSMGTGGGQGFAGPELPIVRGGKRIKLAGYAAGQHFDILLSAHFHTSSNPGTMLANGSMVGYSEYAVRIRGTPEPPMQWLALVHERWGLRERVPVVLDEPRKAEKPRIKVPAVMR